MTIVTGYTPGEDGDRVVDAAAHEAARRDQDLLVVNASTGGAYTDSNLATPDQLEQLQQRLVGTVVDAQVTQVADAINAAEALLEAAEEAEATLVVIGLRPRSRTGKFLFGSTAQTVLLRAPCDVLSVRLEAHH